jgi:hypothetical protein
MINGVSIQCRQWHSTSGHLPHSTRTVAFDDCGTASAAVLRGPAGDMLRMRKDRTLDAGLPNTFEQGNPRGHTRTTYAVAVTPTMVTNPEPATDEGEAPAQVGAGIEDGPREGGNNVMEAHSAGAGTQEDPKRALLWSA